MGYELAFNHNYKLHSTTTYDVETRHVLSDDEINYEL